MTDRERPRESHTGHLYIGDRHAEGLTQQYISVSQLDKDCV